MSLSGQEAVWKSLKKILTEVEEPEIANCEPFLIKRSFTSDPGEPQEGHQEER